MNLASCINKILSVIYPEKITCIFCDAEIFDENKFGMCDKCAKTLPFIKEKVCKKCGDIIKSMANYCDMCQKNPPVFEKASSVFYYKDNIKSAIKKFKFDGCKYLSKYFAEFLADKYFAEKFSCDVITYVPVHEERLKTRGYNQSELLAKDLSNLINIPFVKDAIIKSKKTLYQADLNYKQRQSNLIDAFKVANNKLFKDKSVLLVDDIFTTGATANECVKVVKACGASKVFVLTIAHTIIE